MLTTQIVSSLRETDGGPFYSVPSLSSALVQNGFSVRLRTVGEISPLLPGAQNAEVHSHPISGPFGGVLRSSRSLSEAVHQDARQSSILHGHGLWLMPSIYPAIARRLNPDARLLCSPRGMLGAAALQFSYWKKRAAWHLMQRRALEAADCLHATAISEYDEIRAAGLTNPVTIIPNGIDLPDLVEGVDRCGRRRILSLGRIHPKKGLGNLLVAWARLERRFPEWDLSITGPAEGDHDVELQKLAAALGIERASINGPVFGAEKADVFRNADLFVLPTLNENFGIAVAEALAFQVPAITTTGAPWSGLHTERCGWWIDHGPEPLESALVDAMEMSPAQRREMGERGRAWMERDFSWGGVGREMSAVYRWLCSGEERPVTVRID